MQLYNVSFTTKKLVGKYDAKGNLICEAGLNDPIVLTALPHSTAMSYKNCENFKIEPYQFQNNGRSGANKVSGVGNGTKNVDWTKAAMNGKGVKAGEIKSVKTGTGKSAVQRAAETGDMTGAING